MVSALLYSHLSMFDLQQPIPVLRLFRHFQYNHGASDPGPRSSYGMDYSFCGTDRLWWVHALSDSAGGFLSSYFFTSGVCLQSHDFIGNAWDLLSAFLFLVEMR